MDRDYMEQRRASAAAAARAMGLREGDEVALGGRAYLATRITDDGVEGELTTESGHFVSGSSPDELDMRLPGWVRLPRCPCRRTAIRPVGAVSLREALVRFAPALRFEVNRPHPPPYYEELANLLAALGVAALPREQMAEVFSAPEHERAGLAVAGVVGPDGLILVFGDLTSATAPLSAFQPSGTASPDFSRLSLDDYGNSIRFGEYEASSRSALQAARGYAEELARVGPGGLKGESR